MLLPPRAFARPNKPRATTTTSASREAPDGGAAEADRLVTLPRGMTTMEFVEIFPDNYAQRVFLEDERGRGRCWRIGEQRAEAFVATQPPLRRVHDVIFKSPKVRIFFPVMPGLMPEDGRRAAAGYLYAPAAAAAAPYFAVRSMSLRGAPTLTRILRAVEVVAAQAIALHLEADLGRPKPTYGEVRRLLKDYVVCRLLLRRVGGGNHIYVRLA